MTIEQKIWFYIRGKSRFTAGSVALNLGLEKATVICAFVQNKNITRVEGTTPTEYKVRLR